MWESSKTRAGAVLCGVLLVGAGHVLGCGPTVEVEDTPCVQLCEAQMALCPDILEASVRERGCAGACAGIARAYRQIGCSDELRDYLACQDTDICNGDTIFACGASSEVVECKAEACSADPSADACDDGG